jgi:hypothetical protein
MSLQLPIVSDVVTCRQFRPVTSRIDDGRPELSINTSNVKLVSSIEVMLNVVNIRGTQPRQIKFLILH